MFSQAAIEVVANFRLRDAVSLFFYRGVNEIHSHRVVIQPRRGSVSSQLYVHTFALEGDLPLDDSAPLFVSGARLEECCFNRAALPGVWSLALERLFLNISRQRLREVIGLQGHPVIVALLFIAVIPLFALHCQNVSIYHGQATPNSSSSVLRVCPHG